MFSLFSFDRWFARNKQQQPIVVEKPIQIREDDLNKAVNSFLDDVKENTTKIDEQLTNDEIDKLVQDIITSQAVKQQNITNEVEVEVQEPVANEVKVQVEEQVTTNAVEVEVEEQVTTNAVEVELKVEVEEQVTNAVEVDVQVNNEVEVSIEIPKEEELVASQVTNIPQAPKGKKGRKKGKKE